jgi:hypothetical protein
MKRRFLSALLVTSTIAGAVPLPRTAWAQEAPAVGDEVKLKDGSIFRGTIVELVPSDHVDLLLPSGETRRFPIADVAYQGPAPTSSPAPPPAVPAPGPAPAERPPVPSEPQPAISGKSGEVDVHVTSDQDDVALLVRTGQSDFEGYGAGYRTFVAVSGSSRNYELVCNAPCDARLPAGSHRLALSQNGGRAVEAEKPVHLTEPSSIRVHYESRSGARVGGWLLFGGSLAGGLALMAAGELSSKQDCSTGYCLDMPNPDMGEVGAGAAIAILGPLLSLAFILQHDQANIEIVPANMSGSLKLPGSWGSERVLAAPSNAPGAGVRVRF